MHHTRFMHRCLELAAQSRGLVGFNPLVGSVLVRDGKIIAEGFYRGPGTDHAERNLFNNFDQDIQPTDQLFVNLEPCCHTGLTPPCMDLLIQKGIKNVVYGMQDPDPRVAGRGIEQLRAAGIAVEGPVLRVQCERLNRGYCSLRTSGRPYITLKRAQTRRGKIAAGDGSGLCITSDSQNIWSHTHLRAKHDAILVGVQTVITDNPQLTARYQPTTDNRQPLRIILDPNLRIPLTAKVAAEGTVVVINEEMKKLRNEEIKKLEEKRVKIIYAPVTNNHFAWNALWLQIAMCNVQFATLLVEGGAKTWEIFTSAGIVDEEVILIGK